MCLTVGLLAANVAAQPTIALKLVNRNGSPVALQCIGGSNAGTPCTSDDQCNPNVCGLRANPADKIEIDFFASDWSPNNQRVIGWQTQLDFDSLTSGFRGALEIKTGLRPCSTDCPFSAGSDDCDCDDVFGTCENGFCVFIPPEPQAAGVMINRQRRADYIFAGRLPNIIICILGCDTPLLSDIVFDSGVLYEGVPKYLATMILVVSRQTQQIDAACGIFHITPAPAPISLLSELNDPIPGLVVKGVTINTGPCDCTRLVASDPPNCLIDARQPSEPNGSDPQAPRQFVHLTFNCSDTSDLTIRKVNEIFELTEAPIRPLSPQGIEAITANGPVLTVELSQPLDPKRWTCIEYIGGIGQACWGILPADVDASRTSDADDVTAVIDCVNGETECGLGQCDVDRSGACGPPDMLRVIDLLGGAELYDPWLGETIPVACPSAP